MRKNIYRLLFSLLVSYALPAQSQTELKIDPLMLVSLKEARSVTSKIGAQLFPGWDFSKIPILFYRPNVQEILINFPYKPKGFSVYNGFNPLGSEKIYYRNDTTFFTIDGQNTAFDIDSTRVLVVADRSSNLRTQLTDVALSRTKEFAQKYFDTWGFVQSPYDDLLTMLHEGFHVYQHARAPDKFANEVAIVKYPTLDPQNNALYVLEANILKSAIETNDQSFRMKKIKEFVAVRTYRQSLLDSNLVEYENLNEYAEGLARYIEFKFLKSAQNLKPGLEMNYYPEFKGYGKALDTLLHEKLNRMIDFVSSDNDAFENKYGTGPVRFRLYPLGASEGLLLDEVMPSWKNKIFADKVYLCDLLKEAVHLTGNQLNEYLDSAKNEYGFMKIVADKIQFEADGKKYAQQKADNILNTNQTLIKINYKDFVERAFVYRFTPFGITKVTDSISIFDLVPVLVGFKDSVELDMKDAIPVLIDKGHKYVAFALHVPADDIKISPSGNIETKDFSLYGAAMDLNKSGNVVEIKFKDHSNK